MTQKSSFELVREGSTEVFVLKNKDSVKGPGVKVGDPFYNPAMELNRDLSVIVNQWFVNSQGRQVTLVDGLAASGIRGIRYGREINGDFHVVVNDWDAQAYELIKKNITYTSLENATASHKDLNILLSENRYDSIDIDPFGSPVSFIDSALRSISQSGLISCTATDTAPLCGVYPVVCLRRYGARPLRSAFMKEIGLRILLGFLCREAGKYDKGIEPLLCYSTDYYFRLYVQVQKGKQAANRSVQQFQNISRDVLQRFSRQAVLPEGIGPLWTGKLQKRSVVEKIRTRLFEKPLNRKHEVWNLLHLLEEEADAPLFFYLMEDIAADLKVSLPKRDVLFEQLQEKGFLVARTHCTPTGFKTNASLDEVEYIFRKLVQP